MTNKLHRVPKWTIESARMKTAYEKRAKKTSDDNPSFQERSRDCSKRLRVALRDLAEKRAEYKAAKQVRKAQRKEAWAAKKEIMKKKMQECKESIAQIRMEFRNLLIEMKTPNASVA